MGYIHHRSRGTVPRREIFRLDQSAEKRVRPRPSVSKAKPRAETPESDGCRDRHLRRDSVILMAKYLQRSCPKCNGYLGIVVPERKAKMTVQAINGWCLKCLSACLDFDSRQAPQPLILTHPLLLPGEQI